MKNKLSVLNSEKNIFVSIKISNDKEIQRLNKKFFSREYPTDVLSFSLNEKKEDGTFYLGDIIVNKDQAKRQAKDYGNNLEQEISELVAHGMLHLLGVHHDDDDEKTVHGKYV